MSNEPLAALDRLRAARVVAVLRAPSRASLIPITAALLEGGVTAIEVTMSTPDAIGGIADLKETFEDRVFVGVGTVLDGATARHAVHAGAEYVVSPALIPEVVEATLAVGSVSIPGAYTPTEVVTAWRLGAHVVKVFPATALGPTYLKDLLAPMPFLRLMPTGGVEAGNVSSWLAAGAICVGAGSSLVPGDAIREGQYEVLTRRARAFMAA